MQRSFWETEIEPIVQVWYHYEKWEEYHAGMWRQVSKDEEMVYLKQAIEFTGNTEKYGNFMLEVIEEWPISCEQNLTNLSVNRRAWIGHAACCIAFNCPEHIVRSAWWRLTEQQRKDANVKADLAIAKWEERYNATLQNRN